MLNGIIFRSLVSQYDDSKHILSKIWGKVHESNKLTEIHKELKSRLNHSVQNHFTAPSDKTKILQYVDALLNNDSINKARC